MILPNCRDVSRMIAKGEFEGAPFLGWLRAWLHLLICVHCRRYRRQLRLLTLAARSWANRLIRPSGLEDFERRLVRSLAR